MSKTKVIAIANQKGGVGKTTLNVKAILGNIKIVKKDSETGKAIGIGIITIIKLRKKEDK